MDFYANAPRTGAFTFPGLTLGSAATTITTTGAIDYAIRSKGYRKTTISGGATPTTDINTAAAFPGIKANKGAVIVIGLNAAQEVKACQGPVVPLDAAGAFTQGPQFGPIPSDFAPIAYVVVKAGSTANNTTGWIFGTSNFTGVTGVTATAVSVMGSLPDRPQTS